MKKKHVLTLQHWSNLNEIKRKQVLHNDDNFLYFLTECILNVLGGVVPIDLEELKKFEKELKQLVDPLSDSSRKAKLLSSKRGYKLLVLISTPCTKLLLS